MNPLHRSFPLPPRFSGTLILDRHSLPADPTHPLHQQIAALGLPAQKLQQCQGAFVALRHPEEQALYNVYRDALKAKVTAFHTLLKFDTAPLKELLLRLSLAPEPLPGTQIALTRTHQLFTRARAQYPPETDMTALCLGYEELEFQRLLAKSQQRTQSDLLEV